MSWSLFFYAYLYLAFYVKLSETLHFLHRIACSEYKFLYECLLYFCPGPSCAHVTVGLARESELDTTERERQRALSQLESVFDFVFPLLSFVLSVSNFAFLLQSSNGSELMEGLAGEMLFVISLALKYKK